MHSTRELAFAEKIAIDSEIATASLAFNELVTQKRIEREQIGERYRFIRQILVATEDPNLDIKDRLSTNVKLSLEFLGFDVTDVDEKIRGAIRKEDFWARDRDFLAVVEVTATKNKNPKTKEYNDILGRMATLFKRRDLVPDASRVSGLLILNYDLKTNPFGRPRVYTGDSEEIVRAAGGTGIGLLSTVDLTCLDFLSQP